MLLICQVHRLLILEIVYWPCRDCLLVYINPLPAMKTVVQTRSAEIWRWGRWVQVQPGNIQTTDAFEVEPRWRMLWCYQGNQWRTRQVWHICWQQLWTVCRSRTIRRVCDEQTVHYQSSWRFRDVCWWRHCVVIRSLRHHDLRLLTTKKSFPFCRRICSSKKNGHMTLNFWIFQFCLPFNSCF